MIPDNEYIDLEEDELDPDFEIETEPSLTYSMHIPEDEAEDNTFIGRTDDEKAMQQAILKIINTERGEYEIYSPNYGIELQDLFGKQITYCMSEIKDRITEALLADDRIEKLENFVVKRVNRRNLFVSFTAILEDGSGIDIEREVSV